MLLGANLKTNRGRSVSRDNYRGKVRKHVYVYTLAIPVESRREATR